MAKSLAADDEKTVPGLPFEFPAPTAYPLPLLSIFTPVHHMNGQRNVFVILRFSGIEKSLHTRVKPKIHEKDRLKKWLKGS